MSRHERFELGDELGVAPEGEVGLDPLLHGGDMQFLEPCDLLLGELLVRKVRERRPTPERERLTQALCGSDTVAAGERRAAFGEKPLEAVTVEFVRREAKCVGAADSAQRFGTLTQLL